MRLLNGILALIILASCEVAFAASPSLGIHNVSAYINATTYTSPTGETSQATGSAFVVFVVTPSGNTSSVTVSDSEGNSYIEPTFGSGSNPTADPNDGISIITFLCDTSCKGGANHTVTVASSNETIRLVEFIEIEHAAAIDASAAVYSLTSPLNIPVTPTLAGDFILAAAFQATDITIQPTASGWSTLEHTASTESIGSGYLSDAAVATQNALLEGQSGNGFAGVTIAFKGAGGAACTHAGLAKGGAVSVPNGTSGEYWSKSGTWVTPDCSAVEYWSPQLGNWTVN